MTTRSQDRTDDLKILGSGRLTAPEAGPHRGLLETITNNILDDLRAVLAPCWCRVRGLFAPRGGTRLHVFAEDFKPMPGEQDAAVRAAVAAWKSEPDPHRA